MIAPGARLGNYVVEKQIGEGGMGCVYVAEHPLIGRRVAIKVIHPEYAKNPEAISRFFTEARSVNRIRHPNIVDITDFGENTDGSCYFVMELLEGQSLAARIKRGKLPVPDALAIAAQIADAIGAAHAMNILHRDLKPDNVFLIRRDDTDFVKVLDFGLAKLVGEQEISHKTQSGAVMGTPYYMSPEQCMGRPDIDGRTDVYALGVILYEMLTGRVPFEGRSYGEVIIKHATEPPPRVRVIDPACPEWLDTLVWRCMSKEREQRPASMADLKQAVRPRAITPQPVAPMQTTPSPHAPPPHGLPPHTPAPHGLPPHTPPPPHAPPRPQGPYPSPPPYAGPPRPMPSPFPHGVPPQSYPSPPPYAAPRPMPSPAPYGTPPQPQPYGSPPPYGGPRFPPHSPSASSMGPGPRPAAPSGWTGMRVAMVTLAAVLLVAGVGIGIYVATKRKPDAKDEFLSLMRETAELVETNYDCDAMAYDLESFLDRKGDRLRSAISNIKNESSYDQEKWQAEHQGEIEGVMSRITSALSRCSSNERVTQAFQKMWE